MIDFWDANARAIIGFALTMIVVLLGYIAFFKDTPREHRSGKDRR